jgi:hypothetical protein
MRGSGGTRDPPREGKTLNKSPTPQIYLKEKKPEVLIPTFSLLELGSGKTSLSL